MSNNGWDVVGHENHGPMTDCCSSRTTYILNNLPGSTTRDTQTVKNINSYVKKENQEEDDVAKGAVIPEKYNQESNTYQLELLIISSV